MKIPTVYSDGYYKLKVVNNCNDGFMTIDICNNKYKIKFNYIYDVEFQNPITDIKYRKIIERFNHDREF